VRRKPADDELTGGRRFERDVDQRRGAHRLDHDDVGILPKRGACDAFDLFGAAAHFALADERRSAIVHDIDFVFDRDHVIAPRAVHQVDERRDHRALAAQARSRDEHDAFGFDRQRLHFAGEAELLGRDRADRHHAEHAAGAAMIAEAQAPHASDAFEIGDPLGGLADAQRLVIALGHHRQQQRLDVVGTVRRLAVEHLNFAVDAHGRTRVGREIQRRGAPRGGHAQQAIEA